MGLKYISVLINTIWVYKCSQKQNKFYQIVTLYKAYFSYNVIIYLVYTMYADKIYCNKLITYDVLRVQSTTVP